MSQRATTNQVEAARARTESLRALPRLAEALRLELRATTAIGIVDDHQILLERGATSAASGSSPGAPMMPAVLVRVAARRQRDLCRTVYAVPPPPFSWRTAELLDAPANLWISGEGSLPRLRVFLDSDVPAQLRALSELSPELRDIGVTGHIATRRPPPPVPAAPAAPPGARAEARRDPESLPEHPRELPQRAPESLPEHRLQLPHEVPLEEMRAQVHALIGLERTAARAAAGERVPFVDEATAAMPALRAATELLGLTLSTCPLGFFGEIEGYRIDAARFTMMLRRCVIVVDIELPHHLPGRSWTMWAKGRRFWGRFSSGLGTLLRVRAHSPATGDFALDRRFELLRGSLAPVAARLVALREPLIAHADHHWLSLSNDRLRLGLRVTPALTSEEVVGLVRSGVELARSLGGAAQARLGEGPYR